jgi:hypothetical protein
VLAVFTKDSSFESGEAALVAGWQEESEQNTLIGGLFLDCYSAVCWGIFYAEVRESV